MNLFNLFENEHTRRNRAHTVRDLFDRWTNSEYAPFNSDSGDYNEVIRKAEHFLQDIVDPSQVEGLAHKLCDYWHGEDGTELDEKLGSQLVNRRQAHALITKFKRHSFEEDSTESESKREHTRGYSDAQKGIHKNPYNPHSPAYKAYEEGQQAYRRHFDESVDPQDQHKENHLAAVRAYHAKKKADKEQRSADSRGAFNNWMGGSPEDQTDFMNIRKKGVAKGSGQQLNIQQLATISDEALDNAYHYGRSTPGNTFGWQANLKSAAYAKQMIDQGVTDIEAISDAIHKGWNVTAKAFVQNPDQFDDTEKLKAAGKLEAKLQQRAKLMNIGYSQLPDNEQEKDRVVARALLQAINGAQGVAEGKVKLYTDPSYFGAEVDDAGFDSLPVVNIPTNRLVGFEPDSKMQQPKAMANVKNILAGLEQGDNIPPILVRKYKNGYQVLDGHHRFWAYKVAKKDTIPARVVDPKDIEEVGKQGVAETISTASRARNAAARDYETDLLNKDNEWKQTWLQKTIDFASKTGFQIKTNPSRTKAIFINKQLGFGLQAMIKNHRDDGLTVRYGDLDGKDNFNIDLAPDEFHDTFIRLYKDAKNGRVDQGHKFPTQNQFDPDEPEQKYLRSFLEQGVAEGKKVDRFVGYVEKSEEKAGKSKKDAESIAWATANKRGMLDNKNKKKVEERTETKNEKGDVTSWKDESDWKKSEKKDPRGKVTNLSDRARRGTEKLSQNGRDITKEDSASDQIESGNKSNPKSMKRAANDATGPKFGGYYQGTQKGAPRAGQGFGSMEEGIAGNMTVRSDTLTNLKKPEDLTMKTADPFKGNPNRNNLVSAQARNLVAKGAQTAGPGTGSHQNKALDVKKGDFRKMKHKGSFDFSESTNFLAWAMASGYNVIGNPAVYESAKYEYNMLLAEVKKKVKEDTGPIAPHRTYYGAMDEAGEDPNAAAPAAASATPPGPPPPTPDDNIPDLKPGQYFVWRVYFDDGTKTRMKITDPKFDVNKYYADKNISVINVDYNWKPRGKANAV